MDSFKKDQNIATYLEDNKKFLTVLFFGASWSDESKLMSDVLTELAKDEKNLASMRFLQIEAEDNEELSLKYGVEAVPTFILIKNKEVVHSMSGADAAELRKKLSQFAQISTNQSNGSAVTTEKDLNARLKILINSAPVILFMKGTPQEPRCGFSRQAIEILKNENAPFAFFDILSDSEVREGLKKYSNWPTFPQFYIKGELIGGLDIVKEMVASGEFKSMLPKEETLDQKLKKLVNKSKIMIFMKGNSEEPKCGFSRQLVEILREAGDKYESFDILSDEEVRQGLKEYSKWPTYPQVYVDGELIGGLDIIKELKQNGELNITLKGK